MTSITAIISGIVSIFVCCLSAYIIRSNQNSDVKRLENRKRNRLIFNLLELKFWVDKEVDLDRKLEEFLDAYEQEAVRHVPEMAPGDFKAVRTTVMSILKQQFLVHSEIPVLEEHIETIIKELAEVDPVFAFELTGKYKITAHTARIQAMIDAAGVPPAEDSPAPQLIHDVLRPKMLKDLQKDLLLHIPRIARTTDKQVYKDIQMLAPSPAAVAIDMDDVRELLGDLLPSLQAAVKA